MKANALDLWYAFPDDFKDTAVFERRLRMLSEAEHARMQRFQFDASRREYLAAHTLARTALSRLTSKAPESLQFRINPYGKPLLDPDCDVHFSISRRAGLVACLVAGGREVGLDLEAYKRAGEILEVPHRVFSPPELAQLDALDDERKRDHALSLWTLKEAYVKARGMGFSLPLDKCSVVLHSPGDLSLELDASLQDNAARWRFCLLDYAAHRVALVIDAPQEPQVQMWEMRPSEDRSLQDVAQRWFPRG